MLLGLAAAAAWHSQDSRALADAAQSPGDAAAAADKARRSLPSWYAAAHAAAQQAVSDAFSEALLDWQRSVAQHDSSSSSSPGPAAASTQPQPQRPTVTYDGSQLSVSIPLLPAADLPALLRAVQAGVDQLAAHSRRVEQQQQSWLLSTQRVQHWQLRRQVVEKAGSDPGSNPAANITGREPTTLQQLSVQVAVPLQGSSPHEASGSSASSSSGSSVGGVVGHTAGYVEVSKQGPFTPDELELLSRLVAAANKPGSGSSTSSSSGALQSESTYLSPWGFGNGPDRVLGGAIDRLGGAVVGQLFAELLTELQAGLDYDDDTEQQQQWDWQSRMDRFFGGLSQRLAKQQQQHSSGDGTNGDGQQQQQPDSWEEQMQQLQELLQRELHSMTPPDVVEWLTSLTDQEQDVVQQQQQDGLPGSGGQWRCPPSASSSSSTDSSGQEQPPPPPLLPWQQPAAQSAMRQLEQLGAALYLPSATATPAAPAADGLAAVAGPGQEGQEKEQQQQQWGVLAGYEEQKTLLEDCLLLPLKHPEVYERVSARTRASAKAGGARPRAVLFEGPPGTGKTSTARVLAGRVSLPLVYLPLESIVSKWYGESEQNLSKIFKSCEALGGAIIFLDELDSLATSRDQGDMHEASRRLLGVLLREIDGFNHREDTTGVGSNGSSSGSGSSSSDGSGGDASRRSVVIGATNRRQDLDAALLSRFDLSIHFGLPDELCRTAILRQYAHQLSESEREEIAAATAGFSGRDLRDVCEQTERTWASRIIRGQVEPHQLPALQDYLAAVRQRQREGAAAGPSALAGRQRTQWA